MFNGLFFIIFFVLASVAIVGAGIYILFFIDPPAPVQANFILKQGDYSHKMFRFEYDWTDISIVLGCQKFFDSKDRIFKLDLKKKMVCFPDPGGNKKNDIYQRYEIETLKEK